MKKDRYEIVRKSIVSGSLVSTTSQNWYDDNDNLVPWSGSVYIGPNIGDGIFNYTGSVPVGYYKWNGTTWNSTPVSGITEAQQIPIILNCSADELGGMVTFDGDIEQVKKNIEADIEEAVSEIERLETETETNFKKIKEVYNEIFEL